MNHIWKDKGPKANQIVGEAKQELVLSSLLPTVLCFLCCPRRKAPQEFDLIKGIEGGFLYKPTTGHVSDLSSFLLKVSWPLSGT